MVEGEHDGHPSSTKRKLPNVTTAYVSRYVVYAQRAHVGKQLALLRGSFEAATVCVSGLVHSASRGAPVE